MKKVFEVKGLEELPLLVQELLKLFGEKKIVAFYGSMGVGKTTFIKILCEALGIKDVVTSPTFSIVNEYQTPSREKVFHFDFYRINSEAEAYDMGYEDYFYSGAYCFIEWPEKIESILPVDIIKINISIQNELRIFEVEYDI